MFGYRIVKTNLRARMEEERKQLRAQRDLIIFHFHTKERQRDLTGIIAKISLLNDLLGY